MRIAQAGQVAAITGAAGGLGLELARQLARRGWRVALGDVDEPGLDGAGELVRAAGGEPLTRSVDTRDAAAVAGFADEVFDRWERCDLLINNAGVAAGGAIGQVPLEDWSWCLSVNLLGTVHGCHAFVPRMTRAGRGHVVNVASAAAFVGARLMAPYSVSKAGVVALTETLREELRGTGVAVSVACPWFFRSGLLERVRLPADLSHDRLRSVNESAVEAAGVATKILAGVERGTPLILPQREARVLWWLHRLLPRQAPAIVTWLAERTDPDR